MINAPRLKVICFLFDPQIGGPTIRARSVYSRMIKDGYDVRIAFPRVVGAAGQYMRDADIAVDYLRIDKPVLPRKLFQFLKFCVSSPIALIRVAKYIKRERPDVVHINGAFDVIPAVASWLMRVPIVWHLNDTVFSPKISFILGRVVSGMATVIVTAAERVAIHYGVVDVANRITIHAPVDVSNFKDEVRVGPKSGVNQVALLGNWNWIKGQDRFVNVIDLILNHGCMVQGVIAGKFIDGQRAYWDPILADIKSRQLDSAITPLGFVKDTKTLLKETDILLLTSHSEASPICVLEAMAMGLPQVVFDVGGVHEMLGTDPKTKAGVVVAEGDVTAMAKEVVSLLADTERYKKYSANGIRRACENFSLEKCIELHVLAYDRAISEKNSGEEK